MAPAFVASPAAGPITQPDSTQDTTIDTDIPVSESEDSDLVEDGEDDGFSNVS